MVSKEIVREKRDWRERREKKKGQKKVDSKQQAEGNGTLKVCMAFAFPAFHARHAEFLLPIPAFHPFSPVPR